VRIGVPDPSPRDVRAAYDATHARSLLRDSDRFYRMMARRIADGLRSSRAGRAALLDAGSGGGHLLREAARVGPGAFAALHGLDISRVAIRAARREAPRAILLLAEGERLPYEDRVFDAVACLGNLEHFLEPARGARELARVCRPDGTIWVLLPNSHYSGDIWRVIRTGYGPSHHQPVERFASVNEWRDFLEANGLAVDAVTPYNRFKWWKRLLPGNLAWHFLYRARPAQGEPSSEGRPPSGRHDPVTP
jgi:SAM-dependent methyltransferase